MRVFKKIATPFMHVLPEKALIIINLKDPQVNTTKAFIQACRDTMIHYRVFANKMDGVDDPQKMIKELQKKLEITDITGISTTKGTNFDMVQRQIEAWGVNRIILLGVFNSGKTSIINRICKTKYETGDIPGTTLTFTETKYRETVIIDSVGQLIDVHKPLMVSIDFDGCKSIGEKIKRVFDEEISGLKETSKSNMIAPLIPLIKKGLDAGGKIVAVGAGASALVAKEMAGQGTECGISIMAFTNDYAEAQPISFSKGVGEQEMSISRYFSLAVNSGDIVIGVSASGGTGFVYDLLKRARDKKAITISITENADTPMGKYSDYIIKSEAKPEGPSSSKIQTAHLVIVHALILTLAEEMGVTADESVKYMLPEHIATKKMGIK